MESYDKLEPDDKLQKLNDTLVNTIKIINKIIQINEEEKTTDEQVVVDNNQITNK